MIVMNVFLIQAETRKGLEEQKTMQRRSDGLRHAANSKYLRHGLMIIFFSFALIIRLSAVLTYTRLSC
jgi:hypothetical protein